MTEAQAKEIVDLITGATASRPDEKTVHFFTAAMMVLEYDIALASAKVGTITWDYFPSWGKFKEIYRSQKRLSEPVGEQRTDQYDTSHRALRDAEDVPKRGDHAPEWVHVWRWARLVRDPRNYRSFPQQQGQVDPASIMTEAEFEKLRSEWVEAGSPKVRNPIPSAL